MKKVTVRLMLSANLQSNYTVYGDRQSAGGWVTWRDLLDHLVKIRFVLANWNEYNYHLYGLQNDRGSGLFSQIAGEQPEDGDIIVLTPVSSTAHATACDPGCSNCTDTCDCVVPVKPVEPRNNGERETCFWCGMPTKRVSQTICYCPKCKK